MSNPNHPDSRQLPREVERVLNTDVESLRANDGVHVGGVAGQKDPPDVLLAHRPLMDDEPGPVTDLDCAGARRPAGIDGGLDLGERHPRPPVPGGWCRRWLRDASHRPSESTR
jgi:hypothetical protein